MPTTPVPGQTAPDLDVDLVGGGSWKLADQQPEHFTMVVAYRGHHCPVCRGYATKLAKLQPKFTEAGVDIVTVSMDDESRATKSVEEWGIDELTVGYGVSEATAREWGLYISTGISEDEPDRFSEPGLFLVRPDHTLYYAAVNSMPFGRPDPEQLLDALAFVSAKNYPPRGVEG